MITIEKRLEFPDTYPLSRIGVLSELLFFDIETTGFSGDSSNLYLIGCVFYRDHSWNLIQWFADWADAEEEMLEAFFHFLKNFKILIHFNGDGFDIPYLLKRCAACGLDFDFSGVKSVDLYKKIKPFKKILGLENLKQKTIEGFLEIERQDRFSGGQLIEVYHDYLATGDEALLRLLLLHNEDDLKGMPSILPILAYSDFLDFPFRPDGWKLQKAADAFGQEEQTLFLCYRSEVSLPVPMEADNGPFSLDASGNILTLGISLAEGELKRFYSNYKDYYYLIYEDTAIHKSVGEYVDRAARRKATAKTCYTEVEGLFLPQPSCIFEPCLKREYSERLTYIPFTAGLAEMLAGSKTDRTFLFRKPACEKHAGFCPAGGPEKKEPEKKNSEEKNREKKSPENRNPQDSAETYFKQLMGLFF